MMIKLLILLSVILSIGLLYFLSLSNADKIPMTENSSDSNKSAPVANNTQNDTNNATKNTISIPLEKPPFIKD